MRVLWSRRETSVAGGLGDVGGQTSMTLNQNQPMVALHGKRSWAGTSAVPASGPGTAPEWPRSAGQIQGVKGWLRGLND